MKHFSTLWGILVLGLFSLLVTSCALQSSAGTARHSVFSMPARVELPITHTPTGTADLLWSATSHTLMVTLTVTGLAPKSTHLAHIHSGSCAAMGQIIFGLHPVVADAQGVGSSTTLIAGVTTEIPARGWAINIHNGPPFATGLDARVIACGNLTNVRTTTREVQSAHATLAPTISPDGNVQGMAMVSVMDQTLTVTVSLRGLAPHTTHQVHLHVGTCAKQGAVLFTLKPMAADAQGNAMTVTSIIGHALPPAPWYINVHEAGTMAAMMTPEGFTPIACGDLPSAHTSEAQDHASNHRIGSRAAIRCGTERLCSGKRGMNTSTS